MPSMPNMPEQTTQIAGKHQQHRKIFYLFVCVLTVILSIAGICIARTQVEVSRDLFITILFFCLVCLVLEIVFRLMRNSSALTTYQVNKDKDQTDSGDKKVEKKEVAGAGTNNANGVDNKAYDAEKGGDNKDEKWVKNYVPYDEYPSGKDAAASPADPDSVTVESETTGEEKRREEEKGEKETKEEKKGDEEDKE